MSKKLKGTLDRVWLAGLGALAVAEQEGNDLFQQLVKKGREVEKATERRKPKPWRNKVGISGKFFSPMVDAGEATRASVKADKRTQERSPLLAFLPTPSEVAEVEARQARRLASARRAFLKEFGTFDLSGVDWERLQKEHKIFTVTHRGVTYVPSFQFDENRQPRPAIAKVIQIFGKDTSDWVLALWFTACSNRLEGRRPVDLLSSHPDDVVQAAERETAELVF